MGLAGWDSEQYGLSGLSAVPPLTHPDTQTFSSVNQRVLSSHQLYVRPSGGEWALGVPLSQPPPLPMTPTFSLGVCWEEHWTGSQGWTQAPVVAEAGSLGSLCPSVLGCWAQNRQGVNGARNQLWSQDCPPRFLPVLPRPRWNRASPPAALG